MNSALRISWYRLRATVRHEWGSYLAIVLLVGLIGGLAMGSLAAARRTQSSYSALLASANASQIELATAIANPAIGNGQGYDQAVVQQIAHLPHVTAVASAPGVNAEPLGPDGAPVSVPGFTPQAGTSAGSIGGEFFGIDRLAIRSGRAANPAAVDEFVSSPAIAAAFHFHVGEVVAMGFFTNSQTDLSAFGTSAVQPFRRIDMRLVGIGLPVSGIVADDVDAGLALSYLTPALTRQLLSCCVNYTNTAVRVDSPGHVAGVEAALVRGGAMAGSFEATAVQTEGKADRAIKPLSIALGAFGGITAMAALLIAAQVIGRYVRVHAQESEVLRAFGANPTTVVAFVLLGVIGALVVGSLLAVGVAVALSSLSPLGPIRPFYPTSGISFDWTVLGGGLGVLLVSLSLTAVVVALRYSPRRLARRRRLAAGNPVIVHTDRLLSLPPPAATGIRFALQSGTGADAVPMRSAILGAALAVMVLIATVTFGASLDHLVSTPRLYGWNWSYVLAGGGGGGGGDIPAQKANTLLAHDSYLSAWSPVYFDNLVVDGQNVPIMSTTPGAPVQPPLLSGHGLQGADEIVVGPLTLSSLHKRLGDTVTLNGAGGAHRLRIVGVATMPTIGSSGGLHLEMGIGAVVSTSFLPAFDLNPFNDPETGPYAYLVDVRPGVNQLAAKRSLEAMTGPLSNSYNFGVVVQTVLHPAEIVDYRSLGTTPAVLGASLGVGAVAALGLTLLASVRRRRTEMAVLKTLGFTRSQLSSVVAWQSNVAVVIGTIVGIPVGIAVGRTFWDLFAHEINAVPSPAVPVVLITLIVVGAIVLTNAVAAVPARFAARTPVAFLLRAE